MTFRIRWEKFPLVVCGKGILINPHVTAEDSAELPGSGFRIFNHTVTAAELNGTGVAPCEPGSTNFWCTGVACVCVSACAECCAQLNSHRFGPLLAGKMIGASRSSFKELHRDGPEPSEVGGRGRGPKNQDRSLDTTCPRPAAEEEQLFSRACDWSDWFRRLVLVVAGFCTFENVALRFRVQAELWPVRLMAWKEPALKQSWPSPPGRKACWGSGDGATF